MTKHLIKRVFGAVLVLVLMCIIGLQVQKAEAQVTATLSLSPTSNTVASGQNFTVTLNLNTAGAPIDGVDVYMVHFTPSILQVVDSDSGTAGVQVAAGSLLPITTVNAVNNTTGTIQFSQTASGGGNFTGSGVLATITFQGVANGTSAVTIDHTLGATVDSNVSYQGADRLSSVTNASYVVDASAPTTPGSLSASAVSPTQVNLSWTASTDNVGVTGYSLERCTGSTCTNFAVVASPTGTSSNNTGLTASTTYRYRVRATDAVGNFSSYSTIANATTPAPFDFSMSNGGTRSVTQGQSVTNSISTTLVSGNTAAVTFSTSGLPSGVSASYSPTNCSPACSTTMTMTASGTATTGTTTVTVTGTSGSLTKTTTFSLTVNPSSYQRSFTVAGLEGRSSRVFSGTLELLNSSKAVLASPSFTTNSLGQATVTISLPFQSVYYKVKGAPFLSRLISGIDLASSADVAIPTMLTGDLNNDNFINSIDFSVLNPNWFTSNAGSDLNQDGLVNSLDFSLMNRNWFVRGEE